MRVVYVFSVLSYIWIGCTHPKNESFNQENAQGEWLVQAMHMDKDYYKPNTAIMEFRGDSLYYKNINTEKILAKRRLIYTNDSLTIDTIPIPMNKIKIVGDNLQFVKSLAHKVLNTTSIDETLLLTNPWKTDQGIFVFEKEENILKFISNGTTKYHKFCYEILTYNQAVFLHKKGNQLECDRDFQFIEQVVSISNDQMVTFGFRDGTFKNRVYQSIQTTEDITPVSFQLCNPYLNKNNPADRYYYKGTEYNGGLYHIRKIVNQQYKVPQNSNESGIFQVRFVVNCEGKAGMFEHQAFTYDYELSNFSEEIKQQLLQITRSLQDWIPGRHPHTNQPIDTYIYVSFRIKNGKIIRIYP